MSQIQGCPYAYLQGAVYTTCPRLLHGRVGADPCNGCPAAHEPIEPLVGPYGLSEDELLALVEQAIEKPAEFVVRRPDEHVFRFRARSVVEALHREDML